MKKFYLLGTLIIICSLKCFSQNETPYQGYYYANGTPQFYTDDSTSINIIVNNMNNYDSIVSNLFQLFSASTDEILYDDEDDNIIVNSINIPFMSKTAIIDSIKIENDDIAFFTYSKTINGEKIWLRNEMVFELKENASLSDIQPILANFSFDTITQTRSREYIITCEMESDIITLSNILYNSQYVEYATPDFYSDVQLLTINDPKYPEQYYLNNTGQYITNSNGSGGIATINMDIDAPEAWDFIQNILGSTGDSIRIAVIDTGVEYHEDMLNSNGQSRVIDGYTASGEGAGHPLPQNKHGQACAGIIAASHNDKGIAGIAPKSIIVPIRIFKGNDNLFSNRKIALAIRKSWEDFGAEILSNSWRIKNRSELIDRAILEAATNGRNNKGCIVIFAAGNSGIPQVTYPASLSTTIAVGAVNKNGNKPSFSCFGNGLDIVAFSDYDIRTIDREGEAGYVSGNYYDFFGGTSAACPQVAGVVSLMLAINPNLTESEVKSILYSSAKDIGSNGWDIYFGHGIVNALSAVSEAYFYNHNVSITGDTTVTTCNEYTYSISGQLPPNVTIQWQVSDHFVIVSGQGSNSLNIRPVAATSNSNGATITAKILFSDIEVKTISQSISITNTSISTNYPSLGTEDFNINPQYLNAYWSTNYLLGVTATIKPGCTLYINSTIVCTQEAKIVVEPGARLIIEEHGIITSACAGEMWKGIEVAGMTDRPQTSTYQGVVELLPGATIQNAHFAIATREGYDYSSTGGIIMADSAFFINNKKSIEYWAYPSIGSGQIANNVGYFNKCTFIVNSDNHFATAGTNFQTHISMWGVSGVQFKGCSFINENVTGSPNSAINSIDAGFIVDEYCHNQTDYCICNSNPTRSLFSGFNKAISATTSGNSYLIKIDRSDFLNNSVAVFANNYEEIITTRLDINLNNTSASSIGINLSNCTGYQIEENSFYTTTGYSSGFSPMGVHIYNAGTDENIIYNNDFIRLKYGIKVNGDNNAGNNNDGSRTFPATGLQFMCNYNYSNDYDFCITSTGVVRSSHGKTSKGADNVFSRNGTSDFTNNTAHLLTYYHYSGSQFIPINYTTSSIVLRQIQAQNSCTSTICTSEPENYTKEFSQMDYYLSLQDKYNQILDLFWLLGYDTVLVNYYNGIIEDEELLKAAIACHEELLTISESMAEISNKELRTLKADSIVDMQKIVNWYEIINTINAKYSLVEVLYQIGEYEKSYSSLEAIPALFSLTNSQEEEYDLYVSYYNLINDIRLSGRNIAQLTDSEIILFEQIASSPNYSASLMAQDLLCFFYNICPDKTYEPKDIIYNKLSLPTTDLKYTSSTIANVYPNPGKDEIIVSFISSEILPNTDLSNILFNLYNANGLHVLSYKLSQDTNIINTSDIPAGVYIYKITTPTNIETGKWIKNN